MLKGSAKAALAILWGLCATAAGQESPTILQTPRQAVIEMLSGGQEGLQKHLTVEVQEKLQASMKDAGLLNSISMAKSAGMFQTFETGPLLCVIDNPQQHEKIEVHVDGDTIHGDMDNMDLSFRAIRDDKEETLPVAFRISLNLKQQAEIWRLNALTFSVRLPVGDAKFYDPSVWNPSLLTNNARMIGYNPDPVSEAPAKIPLVRAMRLIGLAENAYAQKHPDRGFTCNIADLVNVGKGFDDGRIYTFLDPEFSGGVYNGYRFSLSGCNEKPSANYQVVAEPVTGNGKVFCSDATRNLRSSNNGSGAMCLSSGMLTNR